MNLINRRTVLMTLGILIAAGTINAQKLIHCRCVYTGITDQVEVLEGETPMEACQTLGRGFVPLHD